MRSEAGSGELQFQPNFGRKRTALDKHAHDPKSRLPIEDPSPRRGGGKS
jgi:hypothetical protein